MRRFREGILRLDTIRAQSDAMWLQGIVRSAAQRVHLCLEVQLGRVTAGTSSRSLLQTILQVYTSAAGSNPDAELLVPLPSFDTLTAGDNLPPIFESRPSTALNAVLDPDFSAALQPVPDFSGEWGLVNSIPRAVIGGTFDRLHAAHKVLLTAGLAICSESLLVGITSDAMVAKKTLSDMIQPFSQRKQAVEDFCRACRPDLSISVVEIADAVGPAGTDATLDALVYSLDSANGVPLVQQARLARGLAPLRPLCIPLLPSPTAASGEKISSTECRMRHLGVYQPIPDAPRKARLLQPYVIGLTGPIACGKSTAAAFLQSRGALFIDCDILGHQSYLPNGPAYGPLVTRFGEGILASPGGPVDRAKLGPLVFGDAAALSELNGIVWPAILALARQRITTAVPGQVVVLDAAVLLQAGWMDVVDEVWTIFVPFAEALQRLMQRNGLTEAQAAQRLAAQPTVRTYLAQSDVWVCSAWEVQQTQSQLDQALAGAVRRARAQARAGELAAHAKDSSLDVLLALHNMSLSAPRPTDEVFDVHCATAAEVVERSLLQLHASRPGDYGPRNMDVRAAFALLDVLHAHEASKL